MRTKIATPEIALNTLDFPSVRCLLKVWRNLRDDADNTYQTLVTYECGALLEW
jgi:hypothetical protein